jgi:hypothetical protein
LDAFKNGKINKNFNHEKYFLKNNKPMLTPIELVVRFYVFADRMLAVFDSNYDRCCGFDLNSKLLVDPGKCKNKPW